MLLLDGWPLGRMRLASPAEIPDAVELDPVGLDQWIPRRVWLEKIPLFCMSAATAIIAIRTQDTSIQTLERLPFSLRVGNALVSYVTYLDQFFLPRELIVFYPHPTDQLSWSMVGGALALLIIITSLAVIWRRRYPYLLVGWLWYLGMLLPVIGVLQVGSQAHADRYTYLPQIGIALAVVWGLADLAQRLSIPLWTRAIAAAAVLGALMEIAWWQGSYWTDSVTLWTHALAVDEQNPLGHNNLAGELSGQGKRDEAIRHYQRAIQLFPGYASPLNNLGVLLSSQENTDAALTFFQHALEVDPAQPQAHANLADILLSRGDYSAAIRECHEALRLKTNFVEPHFILSRTYTKMGDVAAAVRELQEVLALQPNNGDAHNNLANILQNQGHVDEAIEHYQAACQVQPKNALAHFNWGLALQRKGMLTAAAVQWEEAVRLQPDRLAFIARLATLLATCPDSAARNGRRAIELAEHALQLTDNPRPDAYDLLGAAYAESGQFDKAIAAAERGAALASARQRRHGPGDARSLGTLPGRPAVSRGAVSMADPSLASRDAEAARSTARRPWLASLAICAAICLLVAFIYGQAAGFQFVNYDDDEYVYANPNIAPGVTLRGIRWSFTQGLHDRYPLTALTHMLACQWFGTSGGAPSVQRGAAGCRRGAIVSGPTPHDRGSLAQCFRGDGVCRASIAG